MRIPRKVLPLLVPILLLGMGMVVFNSKVFSPILERTLGIEFLVGEENVVHKDDGSYAYTNPGAVFRWRVLIVVVGVLLILGSNTIAGIAFDDHQPMPKTQNDFDAEERESKAPPGRGPPKK